jgi:hypothetical protein
MALKEQHLRHAALLLIDHLPLDHEDALAVLEHVRELIEWRNGIIGSLSPQPKLTVVPFNDAP